jgi:hypothetical protein
MQAGVKKEPKSVAPEAFYQVRWEEEACAARRIAEMHCREQKHRETLKWRTVPTTLLHQNITDHL